MGIAGHLSCHVCPAFVFFYSSVLAEMVFSAETGSGPVWPLLCLEIEGILALNKTFLNTRINSDCTVNLKGLSLI